METVKLSDFLKENKAYDFYVENFKNCEHDKIDIIILKECTNLYIAYSFDWKETPQGYEYWSDLNYKWCELESKENDMLWLSEETL